LDENQKAARQPSDIREDEDYIIKLASGELVTRFDKTTK